jgi:hypothetical protein
VDHIGSEPADRGADRVWVEPSRDQAERRPPASHRRARALEHLYLVPAPSQQCSDLGNRALLAPGRAVAVVEKEDHSAS